MNWEIKNGWALETIQGLPDNHFSGCFCDPPYGIDYLDASWDSAVPGPELWAEVARVCKPGSWVVAYGGTRKWHRLAAAMEDGGLQVKDTMLWLYGSGNPKAMEIAKLIDRKRFDRQEILAVTAWIRAARDAAGLTNADIDRALGGPNMAGHWTSRSQPTVPTLDRVPALLTVLGAEPPEEIRRLLLELNSRKGQPGAAWSQREVIGHTIKKDTSQAGPVPLAACGIERTRRKAVTLTKAAKPEAQRFEGYWTALRPSWEPAILAMVPSDGTLAENAVTHGNAGLNIEGCRIPKPGEEQGGWPANVILDQEAAQVLDKQEPGAARFFYSPKVGREERGALTHPTMKPLNLNEYLARLILPPAGGPVRRLLVPFSGVGSEMLGALRAGWDDVLGIEQSAEYAEAARERISAWEGQGQGPDLEMEDMPLFAGLGDIA